MVRALYTVLLINILSLTTTVVSAQTELSLDAVASATVTQSRKSAENFWTPERMRAAKEYIPQITGNLTQTGKEDIPQSNDPQVVVLPSSENDHSNGTTDARSARTLYLRTTGRVFWSCSANQLSSCSASIIASDSRNLIVTAAHCVYDATTLRWYTNCNWMFVPAYSNGNAPYGIWTPRTFYSFTSYTRRSPDYNYDVAFVVMNPNSGYRIGSYLGFQGLYFNAPYNQYTFSFGYPANINNGQTLSYCPGTPARYSISPNGIAYRGQGLPNCLMRGGSSGGPWIQQFNTVSGSGYTYSVVSFSWSTLPNVLFGPMFDSTVQAAWNQVKGL